MKNENLCRLILLSILIVGLLNGCAGYVPGSQSYWDRRVIELCRNDGGVSIYERIRVSSEERSLLGRNNGHIAIPVKRLAPPGAPVHTEDRQEILNHSNPRVWRTEVIVRARDGHKVASWVSYSRVGGDVPSHAHPSSFTCPEPKEISAELQELFDVTGGGK